MLKFQINRVDVFANNSASNNFYVRSSDYCNGVGYVDVDFGEPVFTTPDFNQHLSCYNGMVSVKGKSVSARVLAWDKQDVMAIQVNDQRKDPQQIITNLRMLRLPDANRGNHTAKSNIEIIDGNIVLIQKFKEDDYYCGSAVVIGLAGKKARAEQTNATTIRLVALPGNADFSIFIASAASFDPKEDIVKEALDKLEAAETTGFDGIVKSTENWWHQFWQKSFVNLTSANGVADYVEKNYNYYLYVMASCSRGDFPTKFNGMLWNTGGDTRAWGAAYWGANQSCIYNALFKANRLELLEPMFTMYSSMYDNCALAARQQWGSKGIYIPETVYFNGPSPLPENIAEEMQALYLAEKPWDQRSDKFKEYAHTKLPYLSRWNWKKDGGWKNGHWQVDVKGDGAFGHTTHIFSRGAKIAYKYWLRYQYTMDTAWLRKKAYPMLKGIAEFYRNFPNVKKENGKYNIYHVNDNESIWGGHNTVEEIAAMKGIFPVAIKASEILGVDQNLRDEWLEFIAHLAPLSKNTDYGSSISKDKISWIRSLPPMDQGHGNRHPDGNTMPVSYFDLTSMEANAKMKKIENITYDTYFPKGINQNTRVGHLSRLPVVGVKLGRTDVTKYLIPNQISAKGTDVPVMANRMDQREGEQTTNVERLGRAAEALQDALCQSVPSAPGEKNVIHIFPAWPQKWDAQFKLLYRGGFIVTSSMQKGVIAFVEIQSKAGAVCRLRNPWPEESVTIYRNGKKWSKEKGDMFVFDTKKDDRFILLPKGVSLKQLK
jgi:hypothetical protein